LRTDRARLAWLLAGLLLGPVALAQTQTSTPPRFKTPERPGAARFEPTSRAKTETMEEVIVSAEKDEWRLPDLGSEWRIEREEQEKAEKGRFEATFLPLYDPETAPRNPDLFQLNKEEERVGTIELFRFKFGRKPR
jgi:hypothetical protein